MVTLTLFSINNDQKIRSIHVYILLQVGIFMGYVFFSFLNVYMFFEH